MSARFILPLLATLMAGGLLGYGIGRWQTPAPPEAGQPSPLAAQQALLERQAAQLEEMRRLLEASQAVRSPVAPIPEGTAAGPAKLRQEIREMVKEELAAASSGQEPPQPEQKPPEPTPANLEASERGHRLLEQAISRRQWTDEDAQELHRLIPQMTGDQRYQVLLKFSASINSGDLVLRTSGPPVF